ncbi:DNA adenine methylase [Rhodopseudomonas julia]|uniref:site-specific DNA-methyltransferase (adenine-specific) n=1 Tax=Rhodopseudomonas julia TaxID=200617 RepID=A0ABU0C754_9BRAD|nr:DNA adenine methylase [Rhodopseudomonas julia]
MFEYFAEAIKANDLYRMTYCEPYAGGAGLALKLLSAGFIERIALNDIDESIYAFWQAVLNTPDAFCSLIEDVPLTIDEWRRQQEIWRARDLSDPLHLGFSAFFLNRTNRSGIIEGAGPIGGYAQEGPWKIGVRLNKPQQIKHIQALQFFRNQIEISNKDALDFVALQFNQPDTFCYLDPPYYSKGSKLYRNFYRHDDHLEILMLLELNRHARWVVSYDDVPQIREIYKHFEPISYSLNYSAGSNPAGREVIFFSDALKAPCVKGFEGSAAA